MSLALPPPDTTGCRQEWHTFRVNYHFPNGRKGYLLIEATSENQARYEARGILSSREMPFWHLDTVFRDDQNIDPDDGRSNFYPAEPPDVGGLVATVLEAPSPVATVGSPPSPVAAHLEENHDRD